MLLGVAGAPLFIILALQMRLARAATARLQQQHAAAQAASARAQASRSRLGDHAEQAEDVRRMREAKLRFERREAGLDRERALLGVTRCSSPSEIKRAYFRAARQTHPDTDRGNPHAAQKFAEVQRAYEALAPAGGGGS